MAGSLVKLQLSGPSPESRTHSPSWGALGSHVLRGSQQMPGFAQVAEPLHGYCRAFQVRPPDCFALLASWVTLLSINIPHVAMLQSRAFASQASAPCHTTSKAFV